MVVMQSQVQRRAPGVCTASKSAAQSKQRTAGPMMLTGRVGNVQPQQLHDGAKLCWCRCGLQACFRRSYVGHAPLGRPSNGRWAALVGDPPPTFAFAALHQV